ncbi:alpha/beta hydrolase [Histomonas meleagridis]|uniref:alpha/beta hydrolase n=1 Tax=Histomonas meleagridis TaxID=135588 RepID=UPI0035593DE6|nr:alpha/beta hydrolase [Histomonas meleagridis]KAH0805182.1 alpha/beta hydrolase [Histomonas meleagridis]
MEFPSTPDKFFESELGTTHYRFFEVDDAPIICVLPGISIPSAAYCTFAKCITKNGFSVLIPDYFGRGFSTPSLNFNYSLPAYINQILGLIKHLKIEKCILVSFSFGALIAANIVAQEPSLISRLVFISPFHFIKQATRPFQGFVLSSYLGQFLLKFVAHQFIAANLATQFSDLKKHEDAYWPTVGCCLQQLKNNSFYCKSISQFIRNFNENSISDEMQKVTQMSVRTLVFLGDKDNIIDIKESEKWWKYWIPNVKVAVRESVGHLMFLEEPDEVAELVKLFLHK